MYISQNDFSRSARIECNEKLIDWRTINMLMVYQDRYEWDVYQHYWIFGWYNWIIYDDIWERISWIVEIRQSHINKLVEMFISKYEISFPERYKTTYTPQKYEFII